MMVETSALAAVMFDGDDALLYTKAIRAADWCRMSAGTFVELALVMEGQGGIEVSRQCDMYVRRAGIIVEPVTVEQAHLARQAFHDFGKGRHPAGLNFG